MIPFILLGTLLVATTVMIHAFGTTMLVERIVNHFMRSEAMHRRPRGLVAISGTVVILLALHTLEILLWAAAYLFLLPPAVLGTLEEATYFSFVTYTTLGYGDITLAGPWRIMSGIEALNGILLAGWSTAMLFAVVQRTWQHNTHMHRHAQEAD